MKPICVMTIAGSDPSGGAGIENDLKTFFTLKTFGACVVTALTIQNTQDFIDILEVSPDFVGRQIDIILNDIEIKAVKTGMIGSADTIKIIADKIKQFSLKNIVVDPIIRSGTGKVLLQKKDVKILREKLFPLAKIATPNIYEAEMISELEIKDINTMKKASKSILGLGLECIIITGGHLEGRPIDLFYDGDKYLELKSERKEKNTLHGAGCTFSSAIASYLAKGENIINATKKAKDFTKKRIENALEVGKGRKVII